MLAESVAGELIQSEIEIRSGRGETFADAVASASARRARGCSRSPPSSGRAARRHRHAPLEPVAGAADHRHRALPAGAGRPPVRGVAQQHVQRCTCTWACAAPIGRCACATGCAPVMPELLAISANSPFLDGRHSGLHSARTQIFTKSFPRCGIPDAFGGWAAYADYVDFLMRTQLDRRAHPDLVERAPAPLVRHGRDADLRRADERRRLHDAGGADHRLRGPGGARPRRGRAVRRSADRG